MAAKRQRRRHGDRVDKRADWIAVLTRLPPDLHKRLLAVGNRKGATLDYLAREMIENCLPGWEQASATTIAASAAGVRE